MMNRIAALLDACLVALYDKGVIDWLPDDGAPDTYTAECEIECSGDVVTVTLCGWFLFLWDTPEGWYVYYAMSDTILPCAQCEATFAANELRTVDGRLLCDYCQWQIEREGVLV